MNISISSYKRFLEKDKKQKAVPSTSSLSSLKTFCRKLNFFKYIPKLNLNKVPIGVVLVCIIVIFTLVVLVANKLRYNFYVDLVTKNFPEAVQVPSDSTGKALYFSPLDRMMSEFEAEINVAFFIFFIVGLRMFLKKVWLNYNPRKIQLWRNI